MSNSIENPYAYRGSTNGSASSMQKSSKSSIIGCLRISLILCLIVFTALKIYLHIKHDKLDEMSLNLRAPKSNLKQQSLGKLDASSTSKNIEVIEDRARARKKGNEAERGFELIRKDRKRESPEVVEEAAEERESSSSQEGTPAAESAKEVKATLKKASFAPAIESVDRVDTKKIDINFVRVKPVDSSKENEESVKYTSSRSVIDNVDGKRVDINFVADKPEPPLTPAAIKDEDSNERVSHEHIATDSNKKVIKAHTSIPIPTIARMGEPGESLKAMRKAAVYWLKTDVGLTVDQEKQLMKWSTIVEDDTLALSLLFDHAPGAADAFSLAPSDFIHDSSLGMKSLPHVVGKSDHLDIMYPTGFSNGMSHRASSEASSGGKENASKTFFFVFTIKPSKISPLLCFFSLVGVGKFCLSESYKPAFVTERGSIMALLLDGQSFPRSREMAGVVAIAYRISGGGGTGGAAGTETEPTVEVSEFGSQVPPALFVRLRVTENPKKMSATNAPSKSFPELAFTCLEMGETKISSYCFWNMLASEVIFIDGPVSDNQATGVYSYLNHRHHLSDPKIYLSALPVPPKKHSKHILYVEDTEAKVLGNATVLGEVKIHSLNNELEPNKVNAEAAIQSGLSVKRERSKTAEAAEVSGLISSDPHTGQKLDVPSIANKISCVGGVDPFKGTPVDVFVPPADSENRLKELWGGSVKAMTLKINKMTIGGNELRKKITEEIATLEELRAELFCPKI